MQAHVEWQNQDFRVKSTTCCPSSKLQSYKSSSWTNKDISGVLDSNVPSGHKSVTNEAPHSEQKSRSHPPKDFRHWRLDDEAQTVFEKADMCPNVQFFWNSAEQANYVLLCNFTSGDKGSSSGVVMKFVLDVSHLLSLSNGKSPWHCKLLLHFTVQ